MWYFAGAAGWVMLLLLCLAHPSLSEDHLPHQRRLIHGDYVAPTTAPTASPTERPTRASPAPTGIPPDSRVPTSYPTDSHAPTDKKDPPNFIFILTDDIGYGDLQSYGHAYSETPNIDRLAQEGSLFTQFYVNGNVCPHTRAGFMTGRNPSWFPNYTAQHGFQGRLTITKMLQDSGYRTGHIGKWNIGGDPQADAIEYGIDDMRRTGHGPTDPLGREQRRIDDAIDFIVGSKNDTTQPFYLNLWLYATHTPIVAPQAIIDRYENLTVNYDDFDDWQKERFLALEAAGGNVDEAMRLYLADIYALDLNIGRLLDTLDEHGLADNTVVVFTSDNGPASPGPDKNQFNVGYAGGLRDGKHSYYEGGPRVPFLLRWPDGGTPAGVVNDSVMFALDWMPTVCTLAGCDIPWDLVEGDNMADVFQGEVRDREQPILFRFITPKLEDFLDRQWIRYKKWKLVRHDKELYDLYSDPGERNNLHADYPTVVAELEKYLDKWSLTLPTVHSRGDDPLLPFDPNETVADLGDLPNVDLVELSSPARMNPTHAVLESSGSLAKKKVGSILLSVATALVFLGLGIM